MYMTYLLRGLKGIDAGRSADRENLAEWSYRGTDNGRGLAAEKDGRSPEAGYACLLEKTRCPTRARSGVASRPRADTHLILAGTDTLRAIQRRGTRRREWNPLWKLEIAE